MNLLIYKTRLTVCLSVRLQGIHLLSLCQSASKAPMDKEVLCRPQIQEKKNLNEKANRPGLMVKIRWSSQIFVSAAQNSGGILFLFQLGPDEARHLVNKDSLFKLSILARYGLGLTDCRFLHCQKFHSDCHLCYFPVYEIHVSELQDGPYWNTFEYHARRSGPWKGLDCSTGNLNRTNYHEICLL